MSTDRSVGVDVVVVGDVNGDESSRRNDLR